MNLSIADWLWNTGILQFGYFVTGDKHEPVRFCPEYLPAYPELLSEVAKLTLEHLDISNISHLIVTADSIPLGITCSLKTSLSLVYSRSRDETAVYDLVGSYNSGHMSALLLNYIDDVETIEKLISSTRSVGLETKSITTLLEMKSVLPLAGIPIQSVFQLVNFVEYLLMTKRLSERQARTVLEWINKS